MRVISAAEIEAALDWDSLIERLRQTFRRGVEVPVRHHHDEIAGGPGGTAAGTGGTLLLMPAWQPGRHLGVKIATVFPGNADQGLPSVMGAYLLLDGKTGAPLALIDGPMLTLKRTAAASALAAGYLARPDCERLLMVGTGALAPHLVMAHAAVRPVCNVLIWGRDPEKAAKLAKRLDRRDFKVEATADLAAAVKGADIVSCATLSTRPLIKGAWLRPGQHLDLVGAFRPDMRESDDGAVRRARVFVDTREGALSEAGDIVQAVASGALDPEDVAGDLFELTRGERAGRRFYDQITLFKSVGTALEDLAAAQLAVERV
jgi:ornithine cyclodeaminase